MAFEGGGVITLQERVHGTPPPITWQNDKLHRVLRVRKGFKNTGMRENNLLSLSYGRIINKSINSADGLLPESFETYQIVEPGNIVMRLTDLQNDKRSLRQGLVKQRGIITSAYDAIQVGEEHNPTFWAYALLALDLAKYYYSLGGGVRQSIKFSDFPNDWIASPDLATQKTIADFLDRETARIDRLIEKKERLVGLLQEQNDATLQMIENELFSGEYPIIRLGYCVLKVGSGKTPTGGASVYQDEGVLFLRSQNIHNDGLRLEDVAYISDETDEDMSGSRVEPLDVLLNITGASLGRATVAPINLPNANVNQHVCIIRPTKYLLPAFLHTTLMTPRLQGLIRAEAFSAGREGLNFENIRNFRVAVPTSLEVQQRFFDRFDQVSTRNRCIADEVGKTLSLLGEYRSALITSAVTGQVDVATWGKQGITDRRLDQIEEEIQA